jgi:4-amino-4-deoxy-L-arabinose transferase-like glycosyltransferase
MRLGDMTRPETASRSHDRRLMAWIIGVAFAIKFVIAWFLPISLDEAYAVAVAREYSLSFFDHPPVAFWLPVIAADLTGIEATVIYRLPFFLLGIGTGWLMYRIGEELGGSRVGLWSGFLYSVAPFFFFSASAIAVPDGPLNFFSALCALLLVRAVKAGGAPPAGLWLGAGAALALAIASKYQAAWIPVAVLLFLVFGPRRHWLLSPVPWAGALVGLLGLVPVVVWNAQHDWASFNFHSARAGQGANPVNFLVMLAVQALYMLPTGLFLGAVGLATSLRRGLAPERLLLALIALGPVAIFNLLYVVSKGTHAHWTAPGWQFALPLGALWLVQAGPRAMRRVLTTAKVLLVVIWVPLVLIVAHANTGLLTRFTHDTPPDWDQTQSIFDFSDLRPRLEERGLWDQTDVFMGSSWAFAGILDTFLKGEKPMRSADLLGAHHFVYLSDATATGRALLMEPALAKDYAAKRDAALALARAWDPEARVLEPIILQRGRQDYVWVALIALTLK